MLPAAIGGGLAIGGALADWFGRNQDAENAAAAYDKIQGLADQTVNQNQQTIDAYRQFMEQMYGSGAAKYADALNAYLESPTYQNANFEYTKGVEDFMDPAANQRVQAAMDAINNAAASNGSRFSSDYINRVGAAQQAKTSEEWEKAYQRLQADRNAQLGVYNANSQNQWNNYNASQNKLQGAVNAYGNDRTAYAQGLGDTMQASINNRLGGLNTQAQTIAGKAQAQQGTGGWSLFGDMLGAGGSFMNNWFNK